jgi:hypothetical protein
MFGLLFDFSRGVGWFFTLIWVPLIVVPDSMKTKAMILQVSIFVLYSEKKKSIKVYFYSIQINRTLSYIANINL